jgi:hypothetical protein
LKFLLSRTAVFTKVYKNVKYSHLKPSSVELVATFELANIKRISLGGIIPKMLR